MRKTIFFLSLMVFSFSVTAQNLNHTLDSLKQVLKKSDTKQQFKALSLLADRYSDIDLDKAMFYAKQSLIKAQILKNDTCIALSYNSIANVFQYKTALDSALFFHKKALKARQNSKDFLGIADSYNNIGIVFDTKGQFPEALTNYFKALYYYDLKKDIEKQAMTNTNIGIVYKAQKEYNKALAYYKKAYNLYVKSKNEMGITISSGNLGSILINFGNYYESLKYSEIAKKGYEKLGCQRYIGYPVSNIAVVYDSLHQFEAANYNYIQAIKLHERYKNAYEIAEISNAYAASLMKQKNYSKSISLSNKAVEYAEKSDAYIQLIQAYKNLSKANAALKNYDNAYHFSNLYSIGKDSLFTTEKTKAVFELETKYQTEKKEKLLLQKETEAKQKNLLLIGMSILAFLLALIGFLIYRQQKQKITQQKQEYKLKKEISKIEMQNKLQEQRLSISRDLHDNIGAQLTFIISSVDNIKYAFEITNEKLNNKLTNISGFARETIVELRDTIWAMNHNQITFEDLEIRITSYIEKAKEAKNQISFSFAFDNELKNHKLSSVQGMNIYRTIQEAVNNSMKYADASIITVNAKMNNNRIKIVIQDNGVGFDVSTIEKGNGLQNMQKRMEEIGGNFTIISTNEGTSIEILL